MRKALELDPKSGNARVWLAASYAFKGQHQQALAECATLEKDPEQWDDAFASTIGSLYAVCGRRDKALQMLDRIRERETHGYVDPGDYAYVHAGLGDNEQAFAYLKRAVEVHSVNLLQMNLEPVFDALRSDPRFAELLRITGPPGAKP